MRMESVQTTHALTGASGKISNGSYTAVLLIEKLRCTVQRRQYEIETECMTISAIVHRAEGVSPYLLLPRQDLPSPSNQNKGKAGHVASEKRTWGYEIASRGE